MEESTIKLIDAAKHGGRDELDALIRQYHQEVYEIAFFMVKNKDDAEDICQEVFIKLIRNLYQLQDSDTFSAWLRMITINECKMFFRKNKSVNVSFDEAEEIENLLTFYRVESANDIPQERLDRLENDRLIFTLIQQLPEKYSRVIIMHYYAEMSYSEMAASLNIREGTVKSRLFYAKRKLRSEILSYEKRHGIPLHSVEMFGSVGRWLLQVLPHTEALTASASQLAPAAMNVVSTQTATALSTTVSNSLATKISIATASVSVAVCIGITVNVFKPDSMDMKEPETAASVTESVSQPSEPEDVPEESSGLSSEASASESVEPSVQEPSVIYIKEPAESSVIYQQKETEPRVIYRDREVIREAEPSVVYITKDSVRRYDHFADLTSDDGLMTFRVYEESNEATLTYFTVTAGDMILPSYVDYEGKQVPVTRIGYSSIAYLDEPDHSKPITLQLPEKLESIPDCCFVYANIETITGGKNVTTIGDSAFIDCEIRELDMREVFPNVVDIGELAFYNNPLEKVVLPDGIMRLPNNAFHETKLREVTTVSDLTFYVPPAETVRLILPDGAVNRDYRHSWALPDNYLPQIVEIPHLYLQYPDHPSDAAESAELYEHPQAHMYSLLENTAVLNLYLPEGMTQLEAFEFENPETLPEEDCPETDEESEMFGRVKNLVLSSTITGIEPDAFTSQRGIIQNILLPKAGKSSAELLQLKQAIEQSPQFTFLKEDESYLWFTDPNAVFPDGKYSLDNPDNLDLQEDPDIDEPTADDPTEIDEPANDNPSEIEEPTEAPS